MFGPALMACPVGYYKARSRSVYFPKQCGWYDFYSGEFIEGGHRLIVDAPYERIPVFVPAGSIIPVGPAVQYAAEKPDAPLTIYIYTGKDAHFTLYEDDGTTYAYENGKFATIPFSWDEGTGTLTIGERQGEFPGMAVKRTFRVVIVSPNSPQPFGSENGAISVEYEGDSLQVMGYSHRTTTCWSAMNSRNSPGSSTHWSSKFTNERSFAGSCSVTVVV